MKRAKKRGGLTGKWEKKGQRKKKTRKGMGFRGVEERGYWGGKDLILITLDRHECFSVLHHLQKDKQRKQRHSLSLGKKRQDTSKRNYFIISLGVIIQAIFIIYLVMSSTHGVARLDCLDIISKCSSAAQFFRTSHLGSLHGFVSSPSPSFCSRTLKTDTPFTCCLCASARSPCKHSRITGCSKRCSSLMFDYHFTCDKLQFLNAL